MLSCRARSSARYALAGVAALAASALLFTASPASASGAHYVALGDSYSSGLGAGSYSGGSCYRSSHAYSKVWASANAPASFAFVACSGATTTDVINSQLAAVSSATSLISITIGGNDVGFASVMETCVLGSNSDCVTAVDNAENQARAVLPGKLGTLFADIRRDAPSAHVVVLGYPEFYDLARSSGCIGLSTTKRKALDGGADVLDGVIKAETGRFGGFTYADVISAFAGHEICDGSSWLHSVDWTFLTDSYHPTAAGQASGYEPVLARAAG